MTDPTAAEVRQLIQEGRAAALAGDTFAARANFRRATELDPGSAEAWLGLSGVAPILAEKREYLQRALAIDPANEEARASLAYVERLQAQGLQIAPARRQEVRRESGDASPLLAAPEPSAPAAEALYCYRHPERETGLRCVQCERPICGQCAQITPVGQLCPECRRARRPANYQVTTADAIVAGVVALIASALIALPFLLFARGFFVFLIIMFLAPAVAELVIRIVDRLTRVKRGRPIQLAVGAGFALGALPWLLLLPNLFLLLFVIVVVVTTTARLR
ncbi:MAG TPA: hypothetical protein VNL77_11135 [Roseiflexaceae bacterium]|nr:hypothetical protein [Roseiflexaceae bacterium]